MPKIKAIFLALLAIMLSSAPLQAGQNTWTTHEWKSSSYDEKYVDMDLGDGTWRHVIEFQLRGQYSLQISDLICNSSGIAEESLNLDEVGSILSYSYEDNKPTSSWTWDVRYLPND